jgi:tRNA pseudouridine32 synthase/23S rRNA pseudouridine746 synthase
VTAAPIRPSTFTLPRGAWRTVFDCLCASFPAIAREVWHDRFARGRVLDANHNPIDSTYPHRSGERIFYFREVPNEKSIPFSETVLHADEHLIVVDKPHFLPVSPVGEYVEHTVLTRLIRRLDNPDITPLHRIDRHTAGLVMFSANKTTRNAYQALFRERRIDKTYEAIAPALTALEFPLTRKTRIVDGDPFFRSQEIDGAPNSETRIDVIERGDTLWRYALYPVTGKKHQLRVHLAALGAPICNDPIYPDYHGEMAPDDYAKPLLLLARELHFADPVTGVARNFRSEILLAPRTLAMTSAPDTDGEPRCPR